MTKYRFFTLELKCTHYSKFYSINFNSKQVQIYFYFLRLKFYNYIKYLFTMYYFVYIYIKINNHLIYAPYQKPQIYCIIYAQLLLYSQPVCGIDDNGPSTEPQHSTNKTQAINDNLYSNFRLNIDLINHSLNLTLIVNYFHDNSKT